MDNYYSNTNSYCLIFIVMSLFFNSIFETFGNGRLVVIKTIFNNFLYFDIILNAVCTHLIEIKMDGIS